MTRETPGTSYLGFSWDAIFYKGFLFDKLDYVLPREHNDIPKHMILDGKEEDPMKGSIPSTVLRHFKSAPVESCGMAKVV